MNPTKASHRLEITETKRKKSIVLDGVEISQACLGFRIEAHGEGAAIVRIDLLCEDISVRADPVSVEIHNLLVGQ